MATVKLVLPPQSFYPPASSGAQARIAAGTNFPIMEWAFDGAADEAIYCMFRAVNYGSGNLTLKLNWYAASGTSGDVKWEAAIAAITPDTDSQDIETKSFATAQTVTDSHLGTTAKRVHTCSITISNLDSIAADDFVALRLKRLGSDGADTINSIDVYLVMAELSYSDT